MSAIPDDLRYTKTHEWVRTDENDMNSVCGITDHAQEMLTDIVFVELPDVDMEVKAGDQVAVVESVKAVSDVYAPVAGRIVEVNTELEDSPENVNNDPYGDGWIFKIEIKNAGELEELMDAISYNEHLESGE